MNVQKRSGEGAMVTTEQQFTESEIMEALEIEYADWKGSPFSFENVYGRLDELDELTREQFNHFVTELGITRCGICGIYCDYHTCEDHLDKIESDRYAAEFDAKWAAGKEG
jgi:hypothetical protein